MSDTPIFWIRSEKLFYKHMEAHDGAENKLGITNSAELAREEERISKKKAVELFESGALDKAGARQIRVTASHS